MKRKNMIILISAAAIASASAIALWSTKNNPTIICNVSKLTKKTASLLPEKVSETPKAPKNFIPNTIIKAVGNTPGNLMNRGFVAEQDDWVYFACKAPYAGIYKSKPDMKTGFQKLCNDDAYNLNVIGDWIFYIKKDTKELCAIRTNGKESAVVINDSCLYFVIKDNYIYYWTGPSARSYAGSSTLFKTKIGEDKKESLGMIPASKNPFIIDDKNIYYISPMLSNDNSSHTLARMSLDGNEKTQLTTTPAANPISCEDWVYYTDNWIDLLLNPMPEDFQCNLWRINKVNSTKEKLCENCLCYNIKDDYIYYMDLSKKLYKMKKDGTGKEEIKLGVKIYEHSDIVPSIILTQQYILIYHEGQYGYFQLKYDGSGQNLIN